MAGQGLLFRAANLVGTCRFVLNNRTPHLNFQALGLKGVAADRLKELNVPEKPKRPLSSYFRFLRERRQALLKENPDAKFAELTKICAASWRELDTAAKARYDEAYRAELKEYARVYLKYAESLTPEQKQALRELSDETKEARDKRRMKKRLRDTNRPKRPVGPYILYVMEQAKSQGKVFSKLLEELKGTWGAMPATEKESYAKAAKENKKKYERDMVAWEAEMVKQGNEDLIRRTTATEMGTSTAPKKTGSEAPRHKVEKTASKEGGPRTYVSEMPEPKSRAGKTTSKEGGPKTDGKE